MADARPEQVAQQPVARGEQAQDLSRVGRTEERTLFKQAWYRFKRNRLAIAALIVMILMLAFGFGAPLVSKFITHQDYSEQSLLEGFKGIGQEGHILGTDNLGRDLLTRLAYGTRVSMIVALLAVASALTLGTSLGALAGFYGRWIDSVIMRIVDIMLSIPSLYLLILIGTLFNVGATALALVIASVSWMGLSRLIRGEIISLKQRDYVDAARVIGSSNTRIIVRHILPNVIPLMIVWATLAIPAFIILEASLSFLGLGVQVPTPSLGNMLNGAITFIDRSWSLIFIPGFTIFVTCLAINLFGNGLRDALDPRLGER